MAIVIGCSCDVGMGNTGKLNCQELFGLTRGLGVMETKANDLSLNKLDLTSATIGADVTALLVNADKSKRLFPVQPLRNVDYPKEETQYETDNTGQKEAIRDGIQSFTAEEWKVSPVYVSKVKQGSCGSKSIFYLAQNGIVGVRRGNDLYPLKVNAFDAQYVPRKGDAVEKMMINFDQDVTIGIGELWMVTWNDLGITIDDLTGLFDANFREVSAPAVDIPALGTSQVEYALTTDYGNGNPEVQNIDGQVAGDFQLFNNTTAAVVALTVVTEVADVKYTFNWLNETPGDSLTLSFLTASGYEGEVTFTQP